MHDQPRPCLRLILGDQLNPLHSWFQAPRPDVIYLLMEVRSETDYVLHHAQKVLGIFAAMRDFAQQLKANGHRVRYVSIDQASNRQDIVANLEALVTHYDASSVEYQAPDEWRLDQALRVWSRTSSVAVNMVDSEHFLTRRDEAQQIFLGKKQWLMEHFYRHQRRRHQILLTPDGKPEGGQWNFDADNRKPWPGQPAEPADMRPCHDHSELWRVIESAGVKTIGDSQATAFRWPLNRAEALQQLDHFIAWGLPHFGDYQDALSEHSWRLFHSLLSFALNTKMLNPHEVVIRAQTAWREGHAPLHAAEGFIRQVLGWREYVRGMYWAQMPAYTRTNQLAHTRALPDWFWNGQTHMACVASALKQSLTQGYAHHIQRLMVTGNFALLAGLDPAQLHRWYLGIYVDAFEWVEAPNTLGMSQWADGGLLATKPYVSSAAYIHRMGDHCKNCRYDHKARTSDNACPFNALYWDFFDRHRTQFETNPRLGVVYHQLKRMPEKTLQELKSFSARTLSNLENL